MGVAHEESSLPLTQKGNNLQIPEITKMWSLGRYTSPNVIRNKSQTLMHYKGFKIGKAQKLLGNSKGTMGQLLVVITELVVQNKLFH